MRGLLIFEKKMKSRSIVIIDGCRTAFMRSGTDYFNLHSYQLAHFPIKSILQRNSLELDIIDTLALGCVINHLAVSNIAREAALLAGISPETPCHTVTQACISANRAIADVANEILSGKSDVGIAGGVDHCSDTPITFSREMRQKLFKAQKLKGIGEYLRFLWSLNLKDFKPQRPLIAEFSTGKVMGQDCDTLAAKCKVSREDQDHYAVRSNLLAAAAYEQNYIQEELAEVSFPPHFIPVKRDNGIRADTTYEKIKTLRPAFDRKNGTLTAANSSFLTDGAAAVLLMEEEKAMALGYTPKARLVDWVFTGQDLQNNLLLGPAYATAKILKKTSMKLSQLDVIEFHEAFAGQILANINALKDRDFCRQNLEWQEAVGEIDMKKFNLWGGSLSIGHPFGATGARLLTTAANRLHKENGRFALLAACAAGAHGHAMLIERL